MQYLNAQAISYIDDSFPGWIRCRVVDRFGKEHFFCEKVPVVTTDNITETTHFPVAVFIAGKHGNRFHDDTGTACVEFDTASPWSIESEEGQTVFSVFENQISERD